MNRFSSLCRQQAREEWYMEKQLFTNDVIISWLQYYSQNTTVDLEHVKMIDITKKK